VFRKPEIAKNISAPTEISARRIDQRWKSTATAQSGYITALNVEPRLASCCKEASSPCAIR